MNKTAKHIISAILTVSMLFAMTATTFAEGTDEEQKVIGVARSFEHEADEFSYGTILNGLERAKAPPTSYYNLANGSYSADLQHVQVNWLYTNRYFKSNADGEIYVSYNVESDVYGFMRIGIYDCSTKKILTTWDTESMAGAVSGDFYFYNLDTTHNYAVAFTAIRDGGSYPTFTGTATISH